MSGRNKTLVDDDRWKKKGGPHKEDEAEVEICPGCEGVGQTWKCGEGEFCPCPMCDGEGVIYK